MNRLFTKNATGVAPDGRWFAGDVNALQDAVAAITDLTQALSVGSIAIGESGLQLVRYGAGEARLSGALRTDKIIRGLGGLFAGSFTSTQRDAITSPPFTLIIFNTTTNQFEWNAGTDVSPDWQPLSAATSANEGGELADLPSAGSVAAWTTYFATDQVSMRISDGSNWYRVGQQPGDIVATLRAAAAPGYILAFGQAWPSTGGIYADAYAALGNPANVPDGQGMALVGYKSGDGSFGTLGGTVGEKTHQLTQGELPSYNINVNVYDGSGGKDSGTFATGDNDGTRSTATVAVGGSNNAHNNIQPSRVVNWQMKL